MNSALPLLKKLYPNDKLDKQLVRYDKLEKKFTAKFGKTDCYFFSTPGRVELGGNHTDHNNGRVLAASIDLDSIAVAALSNNNIISVFSEGYDKPFIINLHNLQKQENETGSTNSLIRGIAAGMIDAGFKIGGFNACISSQVLPGAGLSSSASFEVLIATIINTLFNKQKIKPETIAQISQYAENEYFGKPCGLMDQLACAAGGIISVDFKDAQHPVIQKVLFDFDKQGYDLLLLDTGGGHANLTQEYAAIPSEMKSVAKYFAKKSLRDVSFNELHSKIGELRKRVGDRAILRALHFYNENARVDKQMNALRHDDFPLFLQLMTESGASSLKWLQNIYSAKNIKKQGITLAYALTEKYINETNNGAFRVHGGGFAGTIISLIPANKTKDYKMLMENVFGADALKILSIRQIGTVSNI